jgi:hypothetical protein
VRILATYNVRSSGGKGESIGVFARASGCPNDAVRGDAEDGRAIELPCLRWHAHPGAVK